MAATRLRNACTQDQWGSLCRQMVAVWGEGKRGDVLRNHLEHEIGEVARAAEVFGPSTDPELVQAVLGALDDVRKSAGKE